MQPCDNNATTPPPPHREVCAGGQRMARPRAPRQHDGQRAPLPPQQARRDVPPHLEGG